ncbi:hypothetical protein MYSTI_07066 [Myxococcus stipitatus DSM 14675]|uniref:Uncharacterized protein n=2 Tax=Myxococcus stipitatus TaxID=83455 RepID=L7UK10_MYXSD|nr:hypothetical protein MYSTI_07066 [Myxococcus stipitatus DSM 14675]
MNSMVSSLLGAVTTQPGVKDALFQVDKLGEQGDHASLVALAAGLEARHSATPSERRWRLHAVSDHLEEVLAQGRDFESALALLEVARQPRDARFQGLHSASRRAQDLASLLATFRPASTFIELLAHRRGPDDLTELFACGIHEYVLRGSSLASHPHVRDFWAQVVQRGHPLADLPLTRLAWESSLGLDLGVEDLSASISSLSSRMASDDDDDAPTLPNIQVAVRDEPVPPHFAAVIETRGDDGPPSQYEQRVLKLRPSLPKAPADSIQSVLVDLGLDLLEDADFVTCHRAVLEDVVSSLFGLAVFGARGWQGALGAAHGRLALWRTLAGLSGFEGPLDPKALSARLESCGWYRFEASERVRNASRRLGLVCLRPGGTSMALLAVRDEP